MSEVVKQHEATAEKAKREQSGYRLGDIPQRIKSFGEKAFDWLVYGGIGFVSNELVSAEISKFSDKESTFLHRWKTNTEKTLLEKTTPALEKFSSKRSTKSYFKIDHFWGTKNLQQTLIKNPLAIFILTIGGNLMVIPIRLMEAVKDPVVHTINELWYGKEKANSAEMKEIRTDMNAEPQQSWASQIQSRLVTLFAAISLYLVAGSPKSPTTWALNDTKLDRWCSLDRIGTNFARKLEIFVHPERKADIMQIDKLSPYTVLKESKLPLKLKDSIFTLNAHKYSQVFTISAATSLLFYLTTRVFAARQERKHLSRRLENERTYVTAQPIKEEASSDKTLAADENQAEKSAPSRPQGQIHQPDYHGQQSQSPTLATAAG